MMDSLAAAWDWLASAFEEEQAWVAWMVGVSVVTFLGSLIAVPIVVVAMDADFFVRPEKRGIPLNPLRLLRRILKNVLGWILLVAGLAMLLLPGQGLLTIALGVGLVDFPGKRKLQIRIVKLGKVHRSINWIRKKADKPPLELPR
ncbi:PGPGW domain-containing protein [Pelagicoccus sp. SDUM812005]|uniref:PGPGW domain-containing protein n=1 Tax=Pelagicoccus sp. SDUM812005 TaxID=3041257 RepID=UPI0028104B4A|nr:PGPGW domain-containing protein [Pelagicoccus sp. SDUM812005]MDQ8179545.1 PGPGW domain-containing protein [Pelagicoccus sp. SDUM812005]